MPIAIAKEIAEFVGTAFTLHAFGREDIELATNATERGLWSLAKQAGWTEKAGDTDKLNQILADDWVAIGPDGKTETKQEFLANLKSGQMKMESFEMGPMQVKMVGGAAVVQGSDTEKSTSNGKDSSGKYVWMDVFAKRDGKWMAVRSQTALVK